MKRFKHYDKQYWNEATTVWHALRSYGLYRDLRTHIMRMCVVRYNDWEIAKLQEELAYRLLRKSQRICSSYITNTVEACPPLPFPVGEDVDLRLQRVTIRTNKFLPMKSVWTRLADHNAQ